jgi:hypothetical protein
MDLLKFQDRKKIKRTIITVFLCAILGWTRGFVLAEVMGSPNYKIQSDSINVGGLDSASPNYTAGDTMGEEGIGNSGSASYGMKAGFRQLQTQAVYISMTAPADVVMSPSLGSISGGTSNGETSVTVTTNDTAGYSLSIKGAVSPALVSGVNDIADYVPSGSSPDFNFTVGDSESKFGFSPEGADITSAYLDNSSSCGAGILDTLDKCWNGLSTSDKVIAQSSGATDPSGSVTNIKFRVGVGSARVQPEGDYVATSIITALAL